MNQHPAIDAHDRQRLREGTADLALSLADREPRPFDFTALVLERPRVLELVGRLQAGDVSATTEAQALLDASDAKYEQAATVLRGLGVEGVRAYDSINNMIGELGYVDLDLWLNVALGHRERPAD